MTEMEKGRVHKASQVFTAVLIALFLFISSCEEEKIVEVPVEVPADCPPSAPRGVYAVNLDGYVQICWAPNPENNIAGYGVWVSDEPYGEYEWIEDVPSEETEPWEYCFEYGDEIVPGEPANGEQFYYAVTAFDFEYNESELSYEVVSATPRYEGFMRLYDAAVQSDSCGYDFSTLSSIAQDCTLPSSDIVFDTTGGVNRFTVRMPAVMIQDYGYTSWFDDINTAPVTGWSLAGAAEAIESHCYILRIGESGGEHYVKLWVESVGSGMVGFWWAYQSTPGITDLMPGQPGGETLASGSEGAGAIKTKVFPIGRQVPPTTISGRQEDDRVLQRQNTLP
jgi:hypothetical protein